jgi:hypothetical protein
MMMMMNIDSGDFCMNADQVSDVEMLQGKLRGLYDEMLTLSKKIPTDAFNKFKIKLTNNVLTAANEFLGVAGNASSYKRLRTT